MDKKQLFEHYMLAGHGRAFKLLDSCGEEFRELVLYGCLNDISYDMQCEGSRSLFVYNLALHYKDYKYFLIPAIEKFLSDEVNMDWHIICHLCDFINHFADDAGVESAKEAIDVKYEELYSLIMSMKFGTRAKKITQCYEYLAIAIMQRGDFSRTLHIFKEMGAYFIRRRHTEDIELRWLFEWFFLLSKDEYGESFIERQLDENSRNSKEIACFKRIMTASKREYAGSGVPVLTVDYLIENIGTSSVDRRDIMRFGRKAHDSDKRILAEAVLAEADLNKKASLLSLFTSAYNVFPMDARPLVEYAKSENQRLRDAAIDALVYLRADCAHDFAMELLKKGFLGGSVPESHVCLGALKILIRNYRETDKEFILLQLEEITIDQNNTSGWHDLITHILNITEEVFLPGEIFSFIYEKSRCSICREYAVEELKNRNLLTSEMISECLWDCNGNIRSEAEKLNQSKK